MSKRRYMIRIEADGPSATSREIIVKPIDPPTVTLAALKASDTRTRNGQFHCGTCSLTYGPRGGLSRRFELWRANGALKLWKTRPADFRLPLKHGLRTFGELTHKNAGAFHWADECPLLLLPQERNGLVRLLESKGIREPGRHGLEIESVAPDNRVEAQASGESGELVEDDEPFGHCDSCGRPCDGSGVCPCGGPTAIEREGLSQWEEGQTDVTN